MNAPLLFQPYLRPLVWGGRRLAELGKRLPDDAPYGESWEVSDHPSHRTVVAEGPLAGRSVRELMEGRRRELLGPAADAYSIFPWLIKYLDARDWLSVQVHPDDAAAARLWPGESGKTEVWFILDARPGSRVYAGLLPGVDEAALRGALARGTAAECLFRFEPRPGDCLFFPAGTVHAVGGGVMLTEVQQTSDATFRLYDWGRVDAQGRPRTLHVEQALASIDWSAGPVRPVRADGYPDAAPRRQRLAECRYFQAEYVCQREPFTVGGAGRLQALLVLHGRGRLQGPGRAELTAGDTLVLPASMAARTCAPDGPLALLLATLP
jgi:mannose-6-phosphate isomerase